MTCVISNRGPGNITETRNIVVFIGSLIMDWIWYVYGTINGSILLVNFLIIFLFISFLKIKIPSNVPQFDITQVKYIILATIGSMNLGLIDNT